MLAFAVVSAASSRNTDWVKSGVDSIGLGAGVWLQLVSSNSARTSR